jgi:hypothetical protein
MEHSRTSPKSAPCFVPGPSEPGLRDDLVGWGTPMSTALHQNARKPIDALDLATLWQLGQMEDHSWTTLEEKMGRKSESLGKHSTSPLFRTGSTHWLSALLSVSTTSVSNSDSLSVQLYFELSGTCLYIATHPLYVFSLGQD